MNWQPIETAPKDNSYVFVYNNESDWMYIAQRNRKGIYEVDNSLLCVIPTHWMPLPKRPKKIKL